MEKCLTLFAVLGVVWAAFAVSLAVGIAVTLPSPLEGFKAPSLAGGSCRGRAAQSHFEPAHLERWDLSRVKSFCLSWCQEQLHKIRCLSWSDPGFVCNCGLWIRHCATAVNRDPWIDRAIKHHHCVHFSQVPP